MKNKKKKNDSVKESSTPYLTDEEIVRIIENELPRLIRKRPSLKKKIREMFDDVFVTKEEIKAILKEIKHLRLDMNRRFEAVDRRFEEMRRDMDRRFEEMRKDMDRRFEEMRKDMDRRFEEMRKDMDRRFEEMRKDMDRRFEKVMMEMDKRFEEMRKDMDRRFEETVKMLYRRIDTVGSRWGIKAEEAIRASFEEVLKEMGFEVRKWAKKDTKGEVFLQPRLVEIDILIRNGKTYALEVKSSVTAGEVDAFVKAVRFYEKVEGKKVDRRIIIAVHTYPGVRNYAKKIGVSIFSEPEELKAE